MAQNDSTKRVLITVVVLAAMSFAVPFVANRLNAKVPRVSANTPLQRHSLESDEPDEFFTFVSALPSYQSLENSVVELAASSSEFLKAVAQDDPESLASGAEAYRASLREVRENFAALVDRVGQDRAEAAFNDLNTGIAFDWTLEELMPAPETLE